MIKKNYLCFKNTYKRNPELQFNIQIMVLIKRNKGYKFYKELKQQHQYADPNKFIIIII